MIDLIRTAYLTHSADAAAQIRHVADIRPARDQNDGRRTLEDGGQHDQPAARRSFA
jgi:hypothetical protein